MMKKIGLLLLSLCLASCCSKPKPDWARDMQVKMKRYAPTSRRELAPYFAKAGVHYPPHELALLVFKNTREMQLYARNTGHWKYIKTYHIYAASGGPGPKLRGGDHQVPEGIYHIIDLNPDSRFDLSMEISYPNDFDRMHAALEGRKNLGGNIYIHGEKLSIGCIAIGNSPIQQLFPLVYKIGRHNVLVIIAPNDLRVSKPLKGKVHPQWLPTLYAQIRQELNNFPVHS